MRKFRARVTKDYWFEGTVTVKAENKQEALEKIKQQIPNTELKMKEGVPGSEEIHEIEEVI